jgi:hypothetical protein
VATEAAMYADILEIISFVFGPIISRGFGFLIVFLIAAQAKHWLFTE